MQLHWRPVHSHGAEHEKATRLFLKEVGEVLRCGQRQFFLGEVLLANVLLGQSNDMLRWLFVVDCSRIDVIEVNFNFALVSLGSALRNCLDSLFHTRK